MTRIYISGPMTGLPDNNFPAFDEAAAALRACGYEVVNPAEIDPGVSVDVVGKAAFWQACMRADIRALCDCDALALLPGWQDSDGAHLELHLAHRLGLCIGTVQEFVAVHAAGADTIDCRTCRNYRDHLPIAGQCVSVLRCVAGSSYQRHGAVQLWEASPPTPPPC